jgi:hypothetical protein
VFVGHWELPGSILEGVGVGAGIVGTPLIPAFPISVEPIGIPARLAPPGEIIEGDDGLIALLPVLEVQGEAPVPAIAIPVAPPVPVVPVPGTLVVAGVLGIPAMPPPSKVPVELDVPDVALPATEHGMVLPVVVPNDDAPFGIGLTPLVPSSVAPIGMPAGAADRLPPLPSGEVGSMVGDETDDVCANAALLPSRAATIATMNQCLMVSSLLRNGSRGAALIGQGNVKARRPQPSSADESPAASRPPVETSA